MASGSDDPTWLEKIKTLDLSTPPPPDYLAKGWLDPRDPNQVREELVGELAYRKAFELQAQEVPADALKTVALQLHRCAFGAEKPAPAPFTPEDREIIGQMLEDASAGYHRVETWIVDGFKHVKTQTDLQAFAVHVNAVFQALAAMRFAHDAAAVEEAAREAAQAVR